MESILARSEESKAFTRELCFEFADEAASLWLLRNKAVRAPHYALSDLLELDNRLEAQVDAMRVAGEPGWETCKAKLGSGRPEHFFTAAILAFESSDDARIGVILEKVEPAPAAAESVIAALGWMPYEKSEPHIKNLLMSNSTTRQSIGISATAFHRKDPGSYLENAFYSHNLTLKACSLKAVGDLGGRGDRLMPGRLREQFGAADPASRFWAAWSAAMLGDVSALDLLKSYMLDSSSPFSKDALQLVLRKMELKSALALHQELTKKTDAQRLAVIGAGVISDPATIPWLLHQMQTPALARVAGEAFTLITGVHIGEQELESTWPEGFEAGPNDNPKDSNVALDPDVNLPWPDANKITVWWDEHKSKFKSGKRYLLGRPIAKDHLQTVLQTGFQRQRAAAVLELALLEPGKPLYNICAPARRQMPDQKPEPCPVISPNYGSRQLAITAVNCITSLGHNAAQTAASVRAGITRFRIYDDYQDQNGNPISAAKIQGLGICDDTSDRLLADIAVICQDDLCESFFEKMHHNISQAHLFVCVSSEERFGPDFGEACRRSLLISLAERVANPSVKLIYKGNASLYLAINESAKLIQEKPDCLCVIGCIDSLLDNATLSWFESMGRLKSTSYGRHSGLIPSEAVSFLIIEDYENAVKANRPILTRIATLGLADEPHPRASVASGISKGLTEACNAAIDPLKTQTVHAVFGDLNGEDDRAREWGTVRMRIFETDAKIPPLWSPADTYGDAGAASGGVMACIVAHGFHKKWLPSPVMMFCSDDHGSCGAMILEKEENQVQGAR